LGTSLVPKFAWAGPITNPDHWKLAGLSVLTGLLLSLPMLAYGNGGVLSSQATVILGTEATL
jgi:hypothetical protein